MALPKLPPRHQQVANEIRHRQIERSPGLGACRRKPDYALIEVHLVPGQRRSLPPSHAGEQEQEQIVASYRRQLAHFRVERRQLLGVDGIAIWL